MSDKSLPTSSSEQTSVFSVFRGIGDRYSQFEEDSLMSTSPSAHDNFPEPIKFKPRKSKFHTLHQEDQNTASDVSPDVILPKLIISNKQAQLSGEVFKQQFTAKLNNQRIGLDSSSPHGSIETEPSSSAAVKLFERTQQLGTEKSELGPISKLVCGSSDTSISKTMVLGSERSVSNTSNTTVAVREERNDKKTDSGFQGSMGGGMKTNFPIDTVDSSQSTWSSFSGWLYGGKKVVNIENRDMNALGPSSF